MESEATQEYAVGIGKVLRTCRLQRGDDLLAISRILRIRQPYLKAIEEGRFGDLPGPTYAVGFVRAYAEHLGLDSDEVIRRFKGEISGADGTATLRFPAPRSEGGTPKLAVLFAGALIAVISYGVWYMTSARDDVVAEFVASVPERLGQLLTRDGTTATTAESKHTAQRIESDEDSSPRVAVAATPAADQPDATEPPQSLTAEVEPAAEAATPPSVEAERGETTAGSSPVADPPTTTMTPPAPPSTSSVALAPQSGSTKEVARAAPAPAVADPAATAGAGPQPAVPPAAEGRNGTTFGDPEDSRIVVRATEESWIQVRDEANDRVLLARLLRPGDVYRVPDRAGLNLWTGNAGGLEILVDGEAVPSIGEKGVVRRRVALEVEPLRSGAAVR